jgi:hypothetical protein
VDAIREHHFDLRSPEAQALRQSVADAYAALQMAHASYERALEVAADTDNLSDSLIALRQHGRDYANAIVQYLNAAMAWLSFADKIRVS